MREINQPFIESLIRETLLRCLPDSSAQNGKLSLLARKLFDLPESLRLKEEIVRAGKKLWARDYVDGNGGNLSCRLSSGYVLCTPTLCSKGDLAVEDLCLVSLQNHKAIGGREQSSEIRLHLEIYKAVPQARAVIHCHPPHATAYAITGLIPPAAIIPEAEVFVGPMALAPYETPGTQAFAETVLPFVQRHNTILLANHGIVCWADTVTHAEWYVEVADAYCRTLMLASTLGAPIQEIPREKIADLLQLKKRLGLPDCRYETPVKSKASRPSSKRPEKASPNHGVLKRQSRSFDALVASVTEQVLGFLSGEK